MYTLLTAFHVSNPLINLISKFCNCILPWCKDSLSNYEGWDITMSGETMKPKIKTKRTHSKHSALLLLSTCLCHITIINSTWHFSPLKLTNKNV